MANYNITSPKIILDASIDALSITAVALTRINKRRSAGPYIILDASIDALSITAVALTRINKGRSAGPLLNLGLGGGAGGSSLPTTGQIWPAGLR